MYVIHKLPKLRLLDFQKVKPKVKSIESQNDFSSSRLQEREAAKALFGGAEGEKLKAQMVVSEDAPMDETEGASAAAGAEPALSRREILVPCQLLSLSVLSCSPQSSETLCLCCTNDVILTTVFAPLCTSEVASLNSVLWCVGKDEDSEFAD